MNEILNFALKREFVNWKGFDFQVELGRLKFLKKPVNWILRKLKAFELKQDVTIERITLNRPEMDRFVYEVLMQHKRFNPKDLKCIVMGYNEYKKFLTNANCLTQITHLNTRKLWGYDIVLHPSISGIVPLDFAP